MGNPESPTSYEDRPDNQARFLRNVPIADFDRNNAAFFVCSLTEIITRMQRDPLMYVFDPEQPQTEQRMAMREQGLTRPLFFGPPERKRFLGSLALSTPRWRGVWGAHFAVVIPSGNRLVMDGIPNDILSGSTEQISEGESGSTQLQVYHNAEGYLMADEVSNGRLYWTPSRSMLRQSDGEPDRIQIDRDALQLRATSPDNTTKRVNLRPGSSYTSLITVTATRTLDAEGTYASSDIDISTPNDADEGALAIMSIYNFDPKLFGRQDSAPETRLYIVEEDPLNRWVANDSYYI